MIFGGVLESLTKSREERKRRVRSRGRRLIVKKPSGGGGRAGGRRWWSERCGGGDEFSISTPKVRCGTIFEVIDDLGCTIIVHTLRLDERIGEESFKLASMLLQ